MIKPKSKFFFLFLVFILLMIIDSKSIKPQPQEIQTNQITKALNNLPFYFVENAGQINESVKYHSKIPDGNIYFTSEEVVYQFFQRKKGGKLQDGSLHRKAREESREIKAKNIRVRFVGANKEVNVEGLEESEAKMSYFGGNDPRNWVNGARTYHKVFYRELYPRIDLIVYGIEGRIKHEYRIRAGGEVEKIEVRYEGIEQLRVNEKGELEIEGRERVLKEDTPLSYQIIDGQRIEVDTEYVVDKDNTYNFKVGEYRKDRELIIDPTLIYSTYLGGGSYDYGYGIAVDGSGNVYVTGGTPSSDFPTTTDAFDTSLDGRTDGFITKLNSAGADLIYSTYLGGSDIDHCEGIAVDGSGNAYITGCTESSDFPTTLGAFDTSYKGGGDGFITKLNSAGTDLIYSTYLGCSGIDYCEGIAVDGSGNAYVTGRTWRDDFPTTPGAFDTSYNGDGDGFITKLNFTGTDLIYSTYLGSSDIDSCKGIAVDGSGNAYVTGTTWSDDFPTSFDAYDTNLDGWTDGFITKLNSAGADLIYSTYLGGGDTEIGEGIAIDGSGYAYVTGYTYSDDFPTSFDAYDTSLNGRIDVLITKVNPTGTDLIYSTYLGGGDADYGYGIAVDGSGNAYITGYIDLGYFPYTTGAYDRNYNGLDDVFITKISPTGMSLLYSIYLGGGDSDYGYGIAIDGGGNAYVTGQTDSSDFPTSFGAYDTTYSGIGDVFITKINTLCPVIYRPLSFARKKVLNRSLSQAEYINVLTWQANPNNNNLNIVKYRIYQVEEESRSLLIELYADTFEYWHRKVGKDKQYIYAIVAVDDENEEGIPAYTTIQGSYEKTKNTHIAITSLPESWHSYREFSGDVSGTDNPRTVTLDLNKSIIANFRKIHKPLNFSGQKILNRFLYQAEYINVLTWKANPNNENIEKYSIYQVEGEDQSLLVELDADTFEYWHRNVEKDKQYTYALVAVNNENKESFPVYISIE